MSGIVSTVTLHIESDTKVTPPVNMDHSDEYRTSVFLSNDEGLGAQIAGSIEALRNLADNLHATITMIEVALKEKANV
jgi:hypothetical protein